MIVVSKDIFAKEKCSLEETLLEEPCVEEIVEVLPCDGELVDPIPNKSPTKPIPTSIILPPLPPILFHCFIGLSMSSLPESEAYMIYSPNLD